MPGVIVVVDLHAAEIDQLGAAAAGVFEGRDGRAPGGRKYGFSLDIQGIGLQAALVAGFGQADRIEDADRDVVAIGGPQDLRFARVGGGAAPQELTH